MNEAQASEDTRLANKLGSQRVSCGNIRLKTVNVNAQVSFCQVMKKHGSTMLSVREFESLFFGV
jgi:hypothetical protein